MARMSESEDVDEVTQPLVPRAFLVGLAVLAVLVVLGLIGLFSFQRDDQAAGETFLMANQKKDGVVVLPSGLQYKIVKEGQGPKPGLDETVSVNYRGTLVDGTEFDSSYKRNAPANFQVNRVIPGWTEALQLMPMGSKWELYIPSDLAYGARGMPPTIPKNSALIFEVELIGIGEGARANLPAKKG